MLLPTALPLVAGNTEGDDVVWVVALVVVQTVGCLVRFDLAVFDVEAQAVAAILADLAELGSEPNGGDEVIR